MLKTTLPKTAAQYHTFTAYNRNRMVPHYLDWANQPLPAKTYPGKKMITLPEVSQINQTGLTDVYTREAGELKHEIDGHNMAEVLAISAGLTGRVSHGTSDFYYRAAPSAGALYPNEIYLAWFGGRFLSNGIYHYNQAGRGLVPIRAGDFSGSFSMAIPGAVSGAIAGDKHPTGILVITGVFYASAWKYRDRAYRYVLLDGGHLVENMRLALTAAGISHKIVYDFNDDRIERLLSIDPQREGVVTTILLNDNQSGPPTTDREVPPPEKTLMSVGRTVGREITYDAILSIHNACKKSVAPTDTHRPACSGPAGSPEQIPDLFSAIKEAGLARTVFARRSRRNFSGGTMGKAALMDMLKLVCACADGLDNAQPPVSKTVCPAFAAARVKDVQPGIYTIDTGTRTFSMNCRGDFANIITTACLDQSWLANAAVFFFFRADLEMIDKTRRSRGYRHAMMAGGAMGHAIYLGATALGLGACGIGAFYDNEAAMIHADDGEDENLSLLYLVAAGPVRGRP